MIEVQHVTKRFGTVTVLHDLSVTVPDRGALVVAGPSGCGKTTLLRLIAGLDLPDAGEIQMDGRVVSRPEWGLPPHQRGLGFVFQTAALWPHMTVAQNILFGVPHLRRPEAAERLEEVLTQTSLGGLGRRYPHQLSGGQARRVALARALAPHPRYLLLDEPLTNLQVELKTELLALITQTAASIGAALVYVTHDPAEAAAISDRVLILPEPLPAGEGQRPGLSP